jgi:predicted small lipoprotein YifL
MISSKRTLLVPVLLFSLAGCGLKGPLYLPDERQQEVPASAPATPADGQKVRTPLPPAPQSQKKDRERTSPQSTPNTSTPAQSAPPPVSPPDPDRPATTPPPPGQ